MEGCGLVDGGRDACGQVSWLGLGWPGAQMMARTCEDSMGHLRVVVARSWGSRCIGWGLAVCLGCWGARRVAAGCGWCMGYVKRKGGQSGDGSQGSYRLSRVMASRGGGQGSYRLPLVMASRGPHQQRDGRHHMWSLASQSAGRVHCMCMGCLGAWVYIVCNHIQGVNVMAADGVGHGCGRWVRSAQV